MLNAILKTILKTMIIGFGLAAQAYAYNAVPYESIQYGGQTETYVTHKGKVYKTWWANAQQEPGDTSSWSPWTYVEDVSTPAEEEAASTPVVEEADAVLLADGTEALPYENKAYLGKAFVTHNGKIYKTWWAGAQQEPGDTSSWSPWEYVMDVGSSAPVKPEVQPTPPVQVAGPVDKTIKQYIENAPDTDQFFNPMVDIPLYPLEKFADFAQDKATKTFTLANLQAYKTNECRAAWDGNTMAFDEKYETWELQGGGTYTLVDQLNKLRLAGGDATFSFGGASGVSLAAVCNTKEDLAKAYADVVKLYKVKHINFNVVGTFAAIASEAEFFNKRLGAIKILQNSHPNIKTSFTVSSIFSGLTAHSLELVKSIYDENIQMEKLNIIPRDFSHLVSDENNITASDIVMLSAEATIRQLSAIYTDKSALELQGMLGVTVNIGYDNSVNEELFTIDDAKRVSEFARIAQLSGISYWKLNSDHPCVSQKGVVGGIAYDDLHCSNTETQTKSYEMYENLASALSTGIATNQIVNLLELDETSTFGTTLANAKRNYLAALNLHAATTHQPTTGGSGGSSGSAPEYKPIPSLVEFPIEMELRESDKVVLNALREKKALEDTFTTDLDESWLFAPFDDMTYANLSWDKRKYSMDNGYVQKKNDLGLSNIILAFINLRSDAKQQYDFGADADYKGSTCGAGWAATASLGFDANAGVEAVEAYRNAGGRVALSFGGENGEHLAKICNKTELKREYLKGLARYKPDFFDFDIEGGHVTDVETNEKRLDVLKELQDEYGLKVSLTLPAYNPVSAYDDELKTKSFPEAPMSLVRYAHKIGLKISYYNMMSMAWYSMRDANTTVAANVIQTINNGYQQVSDVVPNLRKSQMRITPKIGVDYDKSEMYPAESAELMNYIIDSGFGGYSFWSLDGDSNDYCYGARNAAPGCTGLVPNADGTMPKYEFTKKAIEVLRERNIGNY